MDNSDQIELEYLIAWRKKLIEEINAYIKMASQEGFEAFVTSKEKLDGILVGLGIAKELMRYTQYDSRVETCQKGNSGETE